MIPNEASCPVFSFTSRRKSVVEFTEYERSKRKEKKKTRKKRARIHTFFSFPSFFFSSLHFLCSPFVLPRFPRFVPRRQSWFSINLAKLQNADACGFAEEKKKETRADRPATVRGHGRPDANECALFILFPKVAEKRMCVIFVRVTRCWRKREKNGKERMQNDDKIRDMTKRDGNVRRKLMIFN